MRVPPYIGLTGPNAAGKGVVADYLRDAHGYHVRSLSDVIREEARRRGQEPVRDVLIPLGNELRREHGPGALAELILPDLEPPALIDSIRNPTEVEVLRRLGGFVLLAVRAPVELRFDRARHRARRGDPETLEDFRAKEARENTGDPTSQQLDATSALADHVIVNDGSLESVHAAVEALLHRLAGAD